MTLCFTGLCGCMRGGGGAFFGGGVSDMRGKMLYGFYAEGYKVKWRVVRETVSLRIYKCI